MRPSREAVQSPDVVLPNRSGKLAWLSGGWALAWSFRVYRTSTSCSHRLFPRTSFSPTTFCLAASISHGCCALVRAVVARTPDLLAAKGRPALKTGQELAALPNPIDNPMVCIAAMGLSADKLVATVPNSRSNSSKCGLSRTPGAVGPDPSAVAQVRSLKCGRSKCGRSSAVAQVRSVQVRSLKCGRSSAVGPSAVAQVRSLKCGRSKCGRSSAVAQVRSLKCGRSSAVAQVRSLKCGRSKCGRSSAVGQVRSVKCGRSSAVAQVRSVKCGRSSAVGPSAVAQVRSLKCGRSKCGRSSAVAQVRSLKCGRSSDKDPSAVINPYEFKCGHR